MVPNFPTADGGPCESGDTRSRLDALWLVRAAPPVPPLPAAGEWVAFRWRLEGCLSGLLLLEEQIVWVSSAMEATRYVVWVATSISEGTVYIAKSQATTFTTIFLSIT